MYNMNTDADSKTGPHLVGQLGSGVQVSTSSQIFILRMHFTRSNIHISALYPSLHQPDARDLPGKC